MTQQSVKVRRLGVMSVALFFAILSALYGLIAGILGVAMAVPTTDLGIIAAITAGIGGILLAIVLWAIGGFIGGAIAAVIYNFIFATTGGIQIDLDVES
ncbi:hypothetical protein [uncultured Methanofollis sp.]|uniref:hypothetical protein n=1 Tax=uncultured Methanofollis sp. TaxID=262500 RepID=UPI00262D8F87|nr:hypothetical protein [uncultured Methanofollis sp.]